VRPSVTPKGEPPNKALQLTAAQPVELQAVAGGRRQLNARTLGRQSGTK